MTRYSIQKANEGFVPPHFSHSLRKYRLIQNLSYPDGNSVNTFIDRNVASVKYASFDDAVQKVLQLGRGSLMAKTDIDSAFRIIPVNPDDFNLLGFKFQGKYYYDTCLTMGSSSAPAIFERFSSAIHFVCNTYLGIDHMVHILDDFLNLGPPNSHICQQN